MDKLSLAAQKIIGAARDHARPSAEDHRRVRVALERSVAAGQAPRWSELAPAESSDRTRGWRVTRKLGVGAFALALALAATTVLWVGWGPTTNPLTRAATPGPGSAAMYGVDSEESRGVAIPGKQTEKPPAVRPAPEPIAKPEPEPIAESDPITTTQRKPKPHSPKAALPSGGVTAELSQLRPATSAMEAGQYGEVLELVREYRRRYPRGAFAQEAAALRVLALCQLDRPGAKKKARKFLSRYPASLTASRVRGVCGLRLPGPP